MILIALSLKGNIIGFELAFIKASKLSEVIDWSKLFLFSSKDLKSTTFPETLYFSADSGLKVWANVTLSFCCATYLNVSKSLSSDDDPKKTTTGVFDTLSKNFSKS